MVHIHHRIGIKAPKENVYEALATIQGIAGWWTRNITGDAAVGKTMFLRFHDRDGKEAGHMDIDVKALEPGTTVRWAFAAGPEEWLPTEVVFELKEEDGYTIVIFRHLNWAEEVPFKAHCSMKWAVFLLSLRQLVETGEGYPAPDDVKIDNWN